MMNRERRNVTRKRCALRGGGFSTNPSSFFPPAGFMAPRETIVWQPEQGMAYARNGMLVNQPNPALAQVAMAVLKVEKTLTLLILVTAQQVELTMALMVHQVM
jgi:hypothetical protein